MINNKENLIMNLTLNGEINGPSCSMIIDSASDISIVNPNLFNNNLNELKDIDKPMTIYTVSNEQFPYKAIKEVTIAIENATLKLDAVFAQIKDECILGLDFLLKSGLLEDFQSIINRKFDINNSVKSVFVNQITQEKIFVTSSTIPEFLNQTFENSCELLNANEQVKVFGRFPKLFL